MCISKFLSFLFHSISGDNVPNNDSGFLLVIIFLTGGGKTSFKLFHISMVTCIKNKLKMLIASIHEYPEGRKLL